MIRNHKKVLYDNETLNANNIVLRKFKINDANDIYEYASDEETLRYLVWDGLKTPDDAINAIVDYYWSRPGIYAIELKEINKCIGALDLRIEVDHEKSGFGYILNRQYWGNGYMTEA